MRVIGLDLGIRTGWAFTDTGPDVDRIRSGEWNLEGRRYDGAGMRFVRFHRALYRLIVEAPSFTTPSLVEPAPVLVYFEEVPETKPDPKRGRATSYARVLWGGFWSQLTTTCESLDVPYAGIHVARIKQRATGKGNASKEAMIRAARTRFRVPIDDTEHNRADALWVLRCGLDEILPPERGPSRDE